MNNLEFKSYIESLKQSVNSLFLEYQSREHIPQMKNDGTLVTTLDHKISQIAENLLKKFSSCHFLSEEKEQSPLEWPCLIIDPIDGTKELVAGIPEVAVSVAYMNSSRIDDKLNNAWVYNPFSKNELASWQTISRTAQKEDLLGLISRTELSRGTQALINCNHISTKAVGSIAFKLSLLAQGQCEFVYSKQPKNIWDIAAGCVLTHKAGLEFYQNGNSLQELASIKLKPNLLWCRDHDKDRILSNL